MNLDPYRNFSKGSRLPADADTFSAFAEGARLARDQQSGVADAIRGQARQGEIVLVKNESGTDLLRGSVLGISDVIITPTDSEDEFLRQTAFRGTTPAAANAGKFVILLGPIKDGAIGRAYVAGVCQVKIDVTDSAHTCADVADSSFILASSTSGTAQILWKEAGTGEKWAVVRFGIPCTGGGGGGLSCSCWEAGSIPSNLSWSVDWGYYDGDGGWHLLGTTSGTLAYSDDIRYGGVSSTTCDLDTGTYTSSAWRGWIGELSAYVANFDFAGEPYNITEIPACRSFTNFLLAGVGLSTCTVDCCNYVTFLCSPLENISGSEAQVVISTYRHVYDCANGYAGYEDCTNEPLFVTFGETPDTACTPTFYYNIEFPITELIPCIPPDYPGAGSIWGRLSITA